MKFMNVSLFKSNTLLNRIPIKNAPTLVGAFFVCLLIIVFAVISVYQETRRYQERAEIFTQNTSKLLAQHIQDVFQTADGVLKTVAHQYNDLHVRGDFNADRFNTYLDTVKPFHKMVSNIRMTDTQGLLRYGTGQLVTTTNLSDRDYFIRLRDLPRGGANTPMIFSGPLFARVSKEWIIVLARRVDNPDGSFAGVVFINLRFNAFEDVFSSIKLGPHGAIVLRTSEMAQIDRYRRGSNPDAEIGNRKVSDKLLKLLEKYPQGSTYEATTNFDQVSRYYTYLKIGEYPFYIIVGEAKVDFLHSIGSSVYWLLGFSFSMIILTILSFTHIHRLTQRRLVEGIDQKAGQIIDASPLAMLVIDGTYWVRNANRAAARLFAYSSQDLMQLSINQLLDNSPNEKEVLKKIFSGEMREQPELQQILINGLRKDGTTIPMGLAFSKIKLEENNYIILVLEDLTQRQKAEAKIYELLRQQTAILAHSSYAIIATDVKGIVHIFNPAAEKMLGFSAQEVIGICPSSLFDTTGKAQKDGQQNVIVNFDAFIATIKDGGDRSDEVYYLRRDGTRFLASRSICTLFDERGRITGYMCVIADVTELKQAQAKLAMLAHYDSLTNLPNRTLLFERIELAVALARRHENQLALLFLDLDKFKPVNDTWGHAIGDKLLNLVASRITSCLRDSDSVGRVGGDEFIVLLNNLHNAKDAVLVAEKIRDSLRLCFDIEGKQIYIGCSIGIAIYPDHGLTSSQLERNADMAMYEAKDKGRDQVVIFND
jgi:diguanylate cyclase (GGDEF)-like protein/PAS domain S-box-containing protein